MPPEFEPLIRMKIRPDEFTEGCRLLYDLENGVSQLLPDKQEAIKNIKHNLTKRWVVCEQSEFNACWGADAVPDIGDNCYKIPDASVLNLSCRLDINTDTEHTETQTIYGKRRAQTFSIQFPISYI